MAQSDGGGRGSSTEARWPVAVMAGLVVAAGLFEVHNLDIPLHARTGEWIWSHGQVPDTNVLSEIHADYPSVHDKWGFQLIAHLLHDLGGSGVVVAARVALLLLLFGVMWRTARGLGATPGAALLFLALAVLAARSRFLFRPGLVSLALLALVVHHVLVRRPDGRGGGRLVGLQVLWVNLHGYFLLGYWTVAAVGAAQLLAGRRDVGRRLLGWAALMAVACLANPAGIDGWWHPYAILADLRQHVDFYTASIEEFQPTFAPDPRQPFDRLAFLALAGASLLLLGGEAWARLRRRSARRDRHRRESADDDGSEPSVHDGRERAGPLADVLVPALVLLLAFGFMSRSLRRNMAPFAVVVAPLAAAACTSRLGRRVPGNVVPAGLALVVAAGELTDFTSVHDGSERRSGIGRSAVAYPDVGIDFIAEHLGDASVFTAFRYGSAFTGRRWPEQVASTNGNTHGYPTSHLREVVAAVGDTDRTAFDRLADRHGHDVALLPMASPLATRLARESAWSLVCLGRQEAVFVRDGAMERSWLAAHDLEPRLAAGRAPPAPRTECGRFLGIPKVCVPVAERSAAAFLLSAGWPRAAREMARSALEVAPADGLSLALAGLSELALGAESEALELLRASLDAPGFHPLADDARRVLAARRADAAR